SFDYICVPCLSLSIDSHYFVLHDTAPTEIYTLSLHDALPILLSEAVLVLGRISFIVLAHRIGIPRVCIDDATHDRRARSSTSTRDRKSTRLNSSHVKISYAVFCLKKKKLNIKYTI